MLVSTNADMAGAPMHVRDLALALHARGVELLVVFGQEGPIEAELRASGVRCEVVPTMRSDLRFWRDGQTVDALVRILCGFVPDIVHAHSAKAGQIARIACRRLGIPCVYTVHGWGFGRGRAWLQAALVRSVERRLVEATTHYIAVSQTDAVVGRERLGIAGRAITPIHNGVHDAPHRARPDASRIIVMVSRAHRGKDHDTLFRATAGLDCEVWCVGGGTETEVFARAAAPHLEDPVRRIRFLGTRDDVPELLAQAGVFVLSSRYEGLPLSIIEAMRAGLPVVASDVGGVPELVRHGETGVLFEVGDAASLRAHLSTLLDDPLLRRRLGESGRQAYERGFSHARMLESTFAVYRSVVREQTAVVPTTAEVREGARVRAAAQPRHLEVSGPSGSFRS